MTQYTKDELRRIFQSRFDKGTWKNILHNLFRAEKIRAEWEEFTTDDDAEKGYFAGVLDTPDAYRIGLFYYKIDKGSVVHKKIGLRNMVRRFINPNWGDFDAAIVVFEDEREWRLSFVCDIKDVATTPRRFTFVFGESTNFYRTPISRFLQLQNEEPSFENIRKAFSVEALSNDFFDGYRELYADFVQYITGKRYVKDGSKWVEKVLDEPNYQLETVFDGEEKLVRDYIKKMFGRIVFLYFLQCKGWLNGDKQYMHNLFYGSDKKDSFLEDVLEILFFEVLNENKLQRVKEVNNLPGGQEIPYLNGGLFAKDEIDERTCVFKTEDFKRLFDFLDSYNFTIDENDTEDAEIGIDPEMLGHIFENLLEDNKDKGAFYTPKEIVSYMCKESIIEYLNGKLPKDTHASIRHFVNTYDDSQLSDDLKYDIRKNLQGLKICDPAIGSGAFPMGMVNVLSHLYVAMKADTNKAIMKRYIMEHNIYGVDIEKGAIDIARLRFWLAMVVEEKEPIPLPNLHFKIMHGNSLLEIYKGLDLSNLTSPTTKGNTQLSIFDSSVSEREDLKLKLGSYYKESDHVNRDKIFYSIINNVRRQIYAKDNNLDQTGLDPSDTDKFFLWHTWFADVFDQGGFDIVIGNPPYIQLQKATGRKAIDKKGKEYDEKLGDLYGNCNYESFEKTGDIYCLFYEKGMSLLKPNGILCYITSNKWMRAGYGESIRRFFATKTNPIKLIDLSGVKVFDNATVDVNILFLKQEKNDKTTIACKINSAESLNNLSDFVQQQGCSCSFDTSESWVILSPIEQSIKSKIEAVGTPLKDWDIQINYGIKTGFNDAFIISTEKREEILNNCQNEEERTRTAELIRPILRGRDIKRYGYEWAGLYLVYIPWHFPYQFDNSITGASEKAEQAFSEQYPAVYNHLLQYKKQLSERNKAETGIRYEWYALQRWGAKYWEDFYKPKIVYMEIQTDNESSGYPFPCYSYDDNKSVVLNTAYIMTSSGFDIKYVLGVLNSKVGRYLTKMYVTQLQQRQFRMLAQYVNNFPIVKASKSNVNEISKLVDAILERPNKAAESRINEIVYMMYNFNSEEISFICSQ
jgi:type I restriction-modification system DNA methylase subunit